MSGGILALLSALLFGISPVLCKMVIGQMSPPLMAGLLYFGSGLALSACSLIRGQSDWRALLVLSDRQRLKLAGAVAFGGIVAPLCLAYGIKLASAFEVSLLLNLETVATTLLAAFLFHEYVGERVWIGKILILGGAFVLCFNPAKPMSISLPAILLVIASVSWGMDNNLTRDVEDLSPVVLGAVKGLAAGTFNLVVAFLVGKGEAALSAVAITLAIGGLSYGLSLILFVKALRLIGASRTSTYFASGPFVGMILSVLMLREQPPHYHWIAAILTLIGVLVLYREKHEHVHTHEIMTHIHTHIHDEHHQHEHDGTEGPAPHSHKHTHAELTHSHPHLPDIHHRHLH
jgi:drug/metabolite transporter (DMT)-like permease